MRPRDSSNSPSGLELVAYGPYDMTHTISYRLYGLVYMALFFKNQ